MKSCASDVVCRLLCSGSAGFFPSAFEAKESLDFVDLPFESSGNSLVCPFRFGSSIRLLLASPPIAPAAPGAGEAPSPAEDIAGERGEGTRSDASPGIFRCDDDEVNEAFSTKERPLDVGIGDILSMLALGLSAGLRVGVWGGLRLNEAGLAKVDWVGAVVGVDISGMSDIDVGALMSDGMEIEETLDEGSVTVILLLQAANASVASYGSPMRQRAS